MAKVHLPDGSVIEAADGVKAKDIAEKIGAGLAEAAVAARINGKLTDLTSTLNGQLTLQIITLKDDDALEIIRHTCAHVMAEALCTIWPEARLVYGPTVKNGFYYDIDLDEPVRPEDFERIEKKMTEIINAAKPIIKTEMSRQKALEKVAGDKYKTDNINHAQGDIISFYAHGDDFEDLCRGPHLSNTSMIAAFKIMSVAGAYWHSDPTKKMLQRIYGTCRSTHLLQA